MSSAPSPLPADPILTEGPHAMSASSTIAEFPTAAGAKFKPAAKSLARAPKGNAGTRGSSRTARPKR